MGYKLAGYDVAGGVEIDSAIMNVYRRNHKPRHSYHMGIAEFNALPDNSIPSELFSLDILDGSPPCSSFSMIGRRERDWGKSRLFREGQAVQVLDDLFGHFLATVEKLSPRVVIAENVKGLISGNAKGYVAEICQTFRRLGYSVQIFLLDSSHMGCVQRRQRVFFVASKTEKQLSLKFSEKHRGLHAAIADVRPENPRLLGKLQGAYWAKAKPGQTFAVSKKQTVRDRFRGHPLHTVPTLTTCDRLFHWSQPRFLQGLEINRVQTFPDDFDFCGQNRTYICGMSVPPYMMQRVAREVQRQILDPVLGTEWVD